MLSLFQALNPSTWLQSVDSGIAGFYWSLPYTTISSSTGLQPFWKSDTEFYTSDDVRDTAVFGYAYPETQYWDYASTDDWRKAVTAYVARTYAPAPRQMLGGGEGQMGMEGVGHVLVDGTYEDWNIEIMADVEKLPGTFRVEFSLAGKDGAPTVLGQWMHSSPLGTNADWKTTHTQPGNAKPKRASTLETTRNGTVGLTAGLLERVAEGRLASLDADAVVPYLAEHLGVRVTGVRLPASPSKS
jgi:tyrosinase